jgi:hypothetical protein
VPDEETGPVNPETRALLGELIAVLAELFPSSFEARLDDYAWLRDSGESVAGAARRVGIAEKTARERYEPRIA